MASPDIPKKASSAVLVVGAASFIGKHICLYFLKLNYQVYGLDSNRSILSKQGRSNYEHIVVDLTDLTALQTQLELLSDVKVIIYSYFYKTVIKHSSINVLTLNRNIISLKYMLKTIKTLKLNIKFIYLSDRSIYEHSSNQLGDIVYPYKTGIIYLKCENLIKKYADKYDIFSVILRKFDIIGETSIIDMGQSEISNIIKSINHRSSYKINGNRYQTVDGTRMYNYIHITDLTNIIDVILLKWFVSYELFSDLKCPYKIINVSTPDNITILQLYRQILGYSRAILAKNVKNIDNVGGLTIVNKYHYYEFSEQYPVIHNPTDKMKFNIVPDLTILAKLNILPRTSLDGVIKTMITSYLIY